VREAERNPLAKPGCGFYSEFETPALIRTLLSSEPSRACKKSSPGPPSIFGVRPKEEVKLWHESTVSTRLADGLYSAA
jgi:hypothetical protein